MGTNRKASRKKRSALGTVLLAVLAFALLAGSAVGNTKAALTYFSENYTSQAEVFHIGVDIIENGNSVDKLLENMLAKDEELEPGKRYDEVLTVKNTGTIDEYVRVKVRCYWTDVKGKTIKRRDLKPEFIDLNFLTGSNGWVIDPISDPMKETTILYYKKPIAPGKETAAFTDSLVIDPKVEDYFTKTEERTWKEGNKTFIEWDTIFVYDGTIFHIDADVDGVQTHNSKDAIKSAWGIDPDDFGIQVTE